MLSVYFLCGSLIVVIVLSILISFFFVDNLSNEEDGDGGDKESPAPRTVISFVNETGE